MLMFHLQHNVWSFTHLFIIVCLSKIFTNASHFHIKKKKEILTKQKVNIPVADTKTETSMKTEKWQVDFSEILNIIFYA